MNARELQRIVGVEKDGGWRAEFSVLPLHLFPIIIPQFANEFSWGWTPLECTTQSDRSTDQA